MREERKEGKGELGDLQKMTKELLELFKTVDNSIAKVDFIIFDYDEKKEGLGIGGIQQENCLRIVQVLNPNRSEGAINEASYSLLPSYMTHTGQLDVRISSVTPEES